MVSNEERKLFVAAWVQLNEQIINEQMNNEQMSKFPTLVFVSKRAKVFCSQKKSESLMSLFVKEQQ